MPYFHDSSNRIVVCCPDNPMVDEQTSGNGIVELRTVSGRIKTTRADNYLCDQVNSYVHRGRPLTQEFNGWKYPTQASMKKEYFVQSTLDTHDSAISDFKATFYPRCPPFTEIDGGEYSLLKEEYEGIARTNPPPTA